jgi:hypothetical protein
MMDHVSARCAHFRLLFPSRNIESIVTLGEEARIVPVPKAGLRDDKMHPPALDLSRLLGATKNPSAQSAATQPAPGNERSRIQLDWVSTDSERRAALIVDAVDEIVASHMQHLERVAFLPARLLALCDGVLRDADATCRLSVRLDVQWPMESFTDRRLWRGAMVWVEPRSQTEERPISAKGAQRPETI